MHKNEARPNCWLPQQLIDAYDAVCPFCLRPPTVEEHVKNTYMFACRNPECSIMPEGKVYGDLRDAADDWRLRVTYMNNLMRHAETLPAKVATLPTGMRISIAESFHDFNTGIEGHTRCLS